MVGVECFSVGREIRDSFCGVVGDFVRGGAGDDAADGGVLPPHYDFCAAGESADFAVAFGADAGCSADSALAGCLAGDGSSSGDSGGSGDAFWSGIGTAVRIDDAGRLSNSESAAVAVGDVLRIAGGGDCAGARTPGARDTLDAPERLGSTGDCRAGGADAAGGGTAEGRDADGGDRRGTGRLAAG